MGESKKISWKLLAVMAFSTVWGFGNVLNGFIYFNGTQVIFSWVLMFALYFVPYALMVGELGSAFRNSGGGVSSWIHETVGPKFAYYAGWTYWACHITYIASKSSGGLKALSWAIFQSAEKYDKLPIRGVQLVTLLILIIFCFLASKGINPLKKLVSIAGAAMFIMSILYILMMFGAPVINPGADYVSLDFSAKNLIPNFNLGYFTSLSILVFAVGGCEKISPYVNKVENPSKGFPKGMIALAIMVVACAILGTIAVGMMFDPVEVGKNFDGYVANGAYWAFQKLGNYYHVGNLLLVIYALCNMIGQLAILLLSIDAPLRMLLDNEQSRKFIPSVLLKQNKHGAFVNGIRMTAILSGSIIVVQMLSENAATVLAQLTKLNSVCMPLRYIWVFVAYIFLRKAKAKFQPDYRFVKNQGVAMGFGIWCLVVTAFCCIMGMYAKDDIMLTLMNVITPIILVVLGMILPMVKNYQDKKAGVK